MLRAIGSPRYIFNWGYCGESEQYQICILKDYSGCSMQNGSEGRQEGCDGSYD